MFLNLPATATTRLSEYLDRQSQLHAAAIAGTAAGYMQDRPYADLNNCVEENRCGPRRGASPLCLLCAVDQGIDRHARTQSEQFTRELFAVGTIIKQAAIDIVEANPDTPSEKADREALVMLSTRLHTGDLRPMTAAEQEDIVMRFRCLRAIDGAGHRGRLRTADETVIADLVRRGWALAGIVTPQGRFAADEARRAAARARSSS